MHDLTQLHQPMPIEKWETNGQFALKNIDLQMTLLCPKGAH